MAGGHCLTKGLKTLITDIDSCRTSSVIGNAIIYYVISEWFKQRLQYRLIANNRFLTSDLREYMAHWKTQGAQKTFNVQNMLKCFVDNCV